MKLEEAHRIIETQRSLDQMRPALERYYQTEAMVTILEDLERRVSMLEIKGKVA
jgi:hypothetical protein